MADIGAFKGEAVCTTTVGGLLGAIRACVLARVNSTSYNPQDRPIWELDAGAQITFWFNQQTVGVTPPLAPTAVILRVYYETDYGLQIVELHNGAPPANGTTFIFHATDTGQAGGAPRAGTVRLFVYAQRSAVGGWVMCSDGNRNDVPNVSSQPVNTADWGAGLIRASMKVSNLTASAYPAGSTFAYGPASDEVLTLTATHTQPWEVRGNEHIRLDALDVTAQQIAGTEKDIASGASTTQQFTANNSFDNAAKSYGAEFVPVGNGGVVPASGAVLWTKFVADGINTFQNGNNARKQSFYNVDPRVTLQNIALGESLYNRGELATVDLNIQNARSENLTRAMDLTIRDSGGAVVATTSDSGANYDFDRTIGASDDADADTIGAQWTIEAGASDAYTTAASNIYKVSSLLLLHSTQVAASGDNDLTVNNDGSISLRNRGESHGWNYYLGFARGAPYATQSGITQEVRADDNALEDSQSESTDANGQVASSYAVAAGDKATYDTVGSQKKLQATHNGNSTQSATDVWRVSSKLLLGSAAGLNDLDIDVLLADSSANGFIDTGTLIGTAASLFNRGERVNLKGYLSFARGAAYVSQSGITANVEDDTDANEDSQSVATDAAGLLDYTYDTVAGDKATADAVGSPKHANYSHNGNSTDDSLENWNLSSLLLFDLHTQVGSATLSADDFPTEDANEQYAAVILGDIVYTWMHAETIRNDGTEINTAGSAHHLEVKDPDTTIQNTFDVDSAPVANNGNLDGWTARIGINPTAPAGNWTYEADVDYLGNTADADHTITYITPLTSNLAVLLSVPAIIEPGDTQRIHVRCEADNAATDPQTQPVYRIFRIEGDDTWAEEVAETDLLNAVDDTATINGADYYADITAPGTEGTYIVWVEAQLNGNAIKAHEPFMSTSSVGGGGGGITGVDRGFILNVDTLDDDANNQVTVIATPFLLTEDNDLELPDEVAESPTLFPQPMATLLKLNGTGAPTVISRDVLMSQVSPSSENHWRRTYSGLAPGFYAVEVVGSINAVPVTAQATFAVGWTRFYITPEGEPQQRRLT